MIAFYYIQDEGGPGKEFIVFSDDPDGDFRYGDFKLYKKGEVDLGEFECAISYESHYTKDT